MIPLTIPAPDACSLAYPAELDVLSTARGLSDLQGFQNCVMRSDRQRLALRAGPKLVSVPGLDPDEIAQSGEVCGPDGTCAVPQR